MIVVGAVLITSFITGAYASSSITSMFITNNPLNIAVVGPQTLSVLIFNGTTSQGQVVTYPVTGWRTVSIATNAGSLVQDWGFVILHIRYVVAPRCYFNAQNVPVVETCFPVEPGQNNPVPVQGDQVWFSFNQDTINATVTVGLFLQK